MGLGFLECQGSLVHSNNLLGDGQAQARAFPLRLGREEGLQDPFDEDIGDSFALVRHDQTQTPGLVPSHQVHPGPGLRGVTGVQKNVHQEVLQEAEIPPQLGQVGSGLYLKRHAGQLKAMHDHGCGRGHQGGRFQLFGNHATAPGQV